MSFSGKTKIWLAIITAIILYTSMTFGPLIANVIANDKESRLRDDYIDDRLDDVEQNYIEIKTKLVYIEKGLDKILEKVG